MNCSKCGEILTMCLCWHYDRKKKFMKNNYYTDQLNKLNLLAPTFSIKFYDGYGNSTNVIDINMESIEYIEALLAKLKRFKQDEIKIRGSVND